jgi:hypothetical protein
MYTMETSKRASAVIVVAALVGIVVGAVPADAATHWWTNCTYMHQLRYPHGVGKKNAHDHTSGTPVTNFYHSTYWYNIAISHNSRLDADHDNIACEKH